MKAFTLAEMLLIMVLLAVAAAFSLPNLGNSFNQIQLQNTVNTLSLTMRYAQSLAITQNKQIRLSFDKSFKNYQLLELTKDQKENKFIALAGRWGKPTSVSSDIKLSPENISMDFLPSGEIEKNEIKVCQKKDCMVITTYDQRGQIEVIDVNE